MLLMIIWYFFHYFFGLGLGLDFMVLASASASWFWPRLTSLVVLEVKRVFLLTAEYHSTVQRLCSTSSLNVRADSPEGATDPSTAQQSDTVKLALQMMLRSFPFSALWMTRLCRLHVFLAKHFPDYAKTCLAIHPPSSLNLSALDDPAATSYPLVAVEYRGNFLTAADGNITSLSSVGCL